MSSGQFITYNDNEETALEGLEFGKGYFVMVVDRENIKLSHSYEEAVNFDPDSHGDLGIEINALNGDLHGFSYGVGEREFSPSDDTIVDSDNNIFTFNNHGFSTGDAVLYEVDPSISSLEDVNVALTFEPKDLSNSIDVSTDEITLTAHGYQTGDEIAYDSATLGTSSNTFYAEDVVVNFALQDFEEYYVLVEDEDNIKIALSEADALDDNFLNLSETEDDEIVSLDDDTIAIAGHGYVGGELITLAQLNTVLDSTTTYFDQTVAIDTPLYTNETYYAIAVDNNTLKLALSEDDATKGVAVDITVSSDLDLTNDTIHIPSHDLVSGQAVNYQVDYLGETGTPIQYNDNGVDTELTVGQYFVYVVDDDTLKLALTETDGINGTNLLDLTVASTDLVHGLTYVDSDAIVKADTPLANTVDGGIYSIVVIDENRFMLTGSSLEATVAEPIRLSGDEVVELSLPSDTNVEHKFTTENFILFDGSSEDVISEDDDEIACSQSHGLTTGEEVTYYSDSDYTDLGLGTGVLHGGTYYVIYVDDLTIQLANSEDDASDGTEIALSLGEGKFHELVTSNQAFQTFNPDAETLDENDNSFTFNAHGLATGDRLIYDANDNEVIGGLTDGMTYYAVKITDDSFQVAETREEALLAETIAFDGSTPHKLRDPNELVNGISITSLLNAQDQVVSKSLIRQKPKWGTFLKNINMLPYTLMLQRSVAGGNPLNQVGGLSKSAKEATNKVKENLNEGENEQDKTKGSASVAVNYFEHTNNTSVSGTLSSGGDIDLFAKTRQKLNTSAESRLSVNEAKNSIGIATVFGFYTNDVQAEIADGAIIDATGNLGVTSDLNYVLIADTLDYYDGTAYESEKNNDAQRWNITKDAGLFWVPTILSGNLLGFEQYLNHSVQSLNKGNKAAKKANAKASGDETLSEEQTAFNLNFAYLAYDNDSQAIIGDADINQNADYQSETQSVDVDANTKMIVMDAVGQPKFNLNAIGAVEAIVSQNISNVVDIYDTRGSDSFGAAINFQLIDNDTIAKIKQGANIQTGTAGEGLKVTADEDFFHLTLGQPSGEADDNGVTGAATILSQISNTIAQIETGVTIIGGPLLIDAENRAVNISYVGSFQKAGSFGVGASAGIQEIIRNTEALIGNEILLADDSDNANGVDDDPAFREDTSTILGTGDNIDDFNTGSDGTVINIVGNDTLLDDGRSALEIRAKNDGFIISAALAGSVSTSKQASNTEENSEQEQGFGFGVSGSVAINNLDEKAQAYINDDGAITIDVATLPIDSQLGVNIFSENDTGLYGLTGGFNSALKTKQETNVGLLGAYSENDISHTTRSLIIGSEIETNGSVNLDAIDLSSIVGIAAGVAGTTSAAEETELTTINVAGSVGFNLFANSTEAFIGNSAIAQSLVGGIPNIGTGAAINLSAVDKSKIVGTAGILEVVFNNATSTATSIGIGVSVVYNETNNETRTYIYNSQLKVGDVSLNSQSKSRVVGASSTTGIITSGVTSAATKNSFGISGVGSGTQNIVNNTIESFIGSDGSTPDDSSDPVLTVVESSGSISVNAIDDTEVLGIAGVLSVAAARGEQSSAAFSVGVTVVDNDVNNKTLAQIGNDSPTVATTTVLAVDVISLDSSSENKTKAYSIAGAVSGSSSTSSGSFSFTGVAAATDNAVTNSTKAKIKNATVTSNNDSLNLSAQDKSKIVSDAGGAGAAISLGGNTTAAISAGIGVSVNNIANDTEAYIDNSTITVNGDLNIEATSTSTIDAFALGASVSAASTTAGNGAAFSLSGAGAGTNNNVENTISAYLNESNVDSVGGSIEISAIDESEITADSGGYAIALAMGDSSLSASIGVSVAYNQVSNTVASYIDSSTVNAAGELTIESDSSSKVDALSIGGSVAGSASTGTGGGLTLGETHLIAEIPARIRFEPDKKV